MSADYDLGTDVGKVRLITGDTDVTPESDAVFTNEEITYFLGVNSNNINLTAADVLEAWAVKYATNATSEHIGDYSFTMQAVANFNKLAKELREKAYGIPVLEISKMDLVEMPDDVEMGE